MNHPLIRQTGLCRDRDGDTGMTPMIQRLEDERAGVLDFIERTVSGAQERGADLTEAERTTLTTSRARVAAIDEQLEPMREFAELRASHRSTGSRPSSGGGDQGGDQGRGLGAQTQTRGHRYGTAGQLLADAWRAATQDDEASRTRLASIGRGIVGGRLAVTDAGAARSVDETWRDRQTSSQTRASAPDVTTTEIPGVLPVSIVGPIVNDLDAARPFIASVGPKDMGGIPGKSFTRPFVSEHVQVDVQSAEKTAVQAGQFKIDDVDFTKATYGGYVDVARQSIDWSAPAMWDALLADFMNIYGLQTELAASGDFVTAVETGTAVDTETAGATPTVQELLQGLYAGAAAVYNGSGRLPDHIWQSLDEWALWGPLMDYLKASTGGDGGGSSAVDSFVGNMLRVPRTVVPSFGSGVTIIGRTDRTEVYEDRIGFLSAVEPKLLGVEIAYGGYMASGTLNVDAFAELTFTPAGP